MPDTERPDPASPHAPPLDLAIIGAGPCGIAAGAAARAAGLRAALFDRGALCQSLLGYPPYMSFFSTPEKLEIEGLPFVTADRNPTRREALDYYRRVSEYFDLDVRQYEDVAGIEGAEGDFRLRTRHRSGREGEHRARRVVVAIGGFHAPNRLDVPGEDLPKVMHYYTEPHPYWRQDVVVVGGGNSAVEASLELFRHGARVTLVHFLDELDPGVKPWILPDIHNRIEAGDIDVRWNARVARIGPERVTLREEGTGASQELGNDWVFALTGWTPDPTLLRKTGVPIDEETGVPEHDADTMETPVRGVFVAGVLAAGYDANRIFIENGRWHGRAIVEAIGAKGS